MMDGMDDTLIKRAEEHSVQRLWITDFFHSFPHYNFNFDQVNSTFNPEEENYRQALLQWAAIPVLACVFFWLVFTIYFIVRCCQSTKSSKTTGSACPKIFTGFMIFFTMCLLGVSLYENEEANGGVETLFNAVSGVNSTMDSASRRIDHLNHAAVDVSGRLSVGLENTFNNIPDITVRNNLLNQVKQIQQQAGRIQSYLNGIEIHGYMDGVDDFLHISDDVEYYRRLITIVICCLFIFVLLVAFVGLIMRSCSILICFSLLSIICSVLIWILCGVYLGSSVALGDFCKDPDAYILSQVDDSPTQKAITTDYLKCVDPQKPYASDINGALEAVSLGAQILNNTVTLAKPYNLPGLDKLVNEMNSDFQISIGNLSSLLKDVGTCTHLHKLYENGLDGSCNTMLTATAFLSMLSFVIAISCVILIFSSSCVWRQYRRHRVCQEFSPVDDTDPFLPPYESDYGAMRFSSPTLWSERGTLQNTNTHLEDSYSSNMS